jgi:hypothetical protein
MWPRPNWPKCLHVYSIGNGDPTALLYELNFVFAVVCERRPVEKGVPGGYLGLDRWVETFLDPLRITHSKRTTAESHWQSYDDRGYQFRTIDATG